MNKQRKKNIFKWNRETFKELDVECFQKWSAKIENMGFLVKI